MTCGGSGVATAPLFFRTSATGTWIHADAKRYPSGRGATYTGLSITMKENFETALKQTLQYEGGWSKDPKDPGGMTMKGVTIATFRKHFGPYQTESALRNITEAQLEHVYKTGYWDAVHGDDLPSGVDCAMFDFAVNSGADRAIKTLQNAVDVTADGVIGPKTFLRVRALPATLVIEHLCSRRLVFLEGLHHWVTYGKGWSRRVAGIQQLAKRLADQ